MVANRLETGKTAIFTIRYYGGYYTTNIINRMYNSATVLEYDFNDVITGDYRFNYWLVNGETTKLIKTL